MPFNSLRSIHHGQTGHQYFQGQNPMGCLIPGLVHHQNVKVFISVISLFTDPLLCAFYSGCGLVPADKSRTVQSPTLESLANVSSALHPFLIIALLFQFLSFFPSVGCSLTSLCVDHMIMFWIINCHQDAVARLSSVTACLLSTVRINPIQNSILSG